MRWSASSRGALVAALVMVGAHVAMRVFGLGAHTSALAGMPVDDSSLAIATIYVVLYLSAVVVAPVLVLAAALERAQVHLVPLLRARGPR